MEWDNPADIPVVAVEFGVLVNGRNMGVRRKLVPESEATPELMKEIMERLKKQTEERYLELARQYGRTCSIAFY